MEPTRRRLVVEVAVAAVLGALALALLRLYPGIRDAGSTVDRSAVRAGVDWTLWNLFLPGVLPGTLAGIACSVLLFGGKGAPNLVLGLGGGALGNALVYGGTWFMLRTGVGKRWFRRTAALLLWLVWIVGATLVGVLFNFDLSGSD